MIKKYYSNPSKDKKKMSPVVQDYSPHHCLAQNKATTLESHKDHKRDRIVLDMNLTHIGVSYISSHMLYHRF